LPCYGKTRSYVEFLILTVRCNTYCSVDTRGPWTSTQ